ncbi:MAG: hypothetical protein AB1690_02645 [Candidatus Zixiibacteriota bacterium]
MRKLTLGSLLLFTFIILSLTILMPPDEAQAIPAFARKYSMSCTTCHAPYPRLKEYGDEFAGNGFVLKDKDAPRYFVETGDQKLSLIRELPFAVRLEGYTSYISASNRNLDFTSPYIAKLLSGGTLAKDISYYFYFFFSERGDATVGIEDAFVMFNNLFNSELDFYIGQFQISDPLFKRELRLTYEDYQVYKFRPGSSLINLAYDRGIMMTYGFASGTDVVLEVLNGNGLNAADEMHLYDNDKYKNLFGRVSQNMGEYLRVGGIGFYGKEKQEAVNEVTMFGGDATIAYGPLELNLQYLDRKDTDPDMTGTDIDLKTRGGMAELIVNPHGDRSDWYLVALYNQIDSDRQDLKYQTLTGHIGYLLRTNVRLTGEVSYDIENEESRVVLGIITAF